MNRFLAIATEAGFFILAYVAFCLSLADFIDGVGGYRIEAFVAVLAAASGVFVDFREQERRRRLAAGRARVWRRRDDEAGLR